jgi:hypothetical protein
MTLTIMLMSACRVAMLVCLLLLPGTMRANPLSEDSIKASYLLNFMKYTEWPATALSNIELRVCSLDARPLSGKLAELQGRQIQGREIRVSTSVNSETWRDCHLLFLSSVEKNRLDSVLRNLAKAPVLTVGESADFIQAGGIIGLKLRAGRVRFNINLGAARQAELNLSSQLLKLADEVMQ